MKPWDWAIRTTCPEDGLLLAVIHLALMDSNSSKPELQEDALEFLTSEEFQDILDALGIPNFVRLAMPLTGTLKPILQSQDCIP